MPAPRTDVLPAERGDFDAGSARALESGVGGVALIALQVSRQSLILSVVDAPARAMALRLAENSARSLVAQASSGAGVERTWSAADLRDAVAEPSGAAPTMVLPLRLPVRSAQSEVFAFLQSVSGAPADQVRSAPADSVSRDSSAAPQPDQTPVSVPDPRLACALLPFLALLILRSRLFR
jgi:hypothetical protein